MDDGRVREPNQAASPTEGQPAAPSIPEPPPFQPDPSLIGDMQRAEKPDRPN